MRCRTKSDELFAAALKYIPGGVNSPVRAFRAVGGQPLFVNQAKGAQQRKRAFGHLLVFPFKIGVDEGHPPAQPPLVKFRCLLDVHKSVPDMPYYVAQVAVPCPVLVVRVWPPRPTLQSTGRPQQPASTLEEPCSCPAVSFLHTDVGFEIGIFKTRSQTITRKLPTPGWQ